MGDEEEQRKRKGKEKVDEMEDGDKRARTSTCFRCHRTPCVCLQLLGNRDNPGENAPPSAPAVDNQPHGRPMEQQSGVAHGFNISSFHQFIIQKLREMEAQQQEQQIQVRNTHPPEKDFGWKMAMRDLRLNLPYGHPMGITGIDLDRLGRTPQRPSRRYRGGHQGMAAAHGSRSRPPPTTAECPLCHDSGFVHNTICACQQTQHQQHPHEPVSTIAAQQQQQQQQLQHMAEQGAGWPPQALQVPGAYESPSTTGAHHHHHHQQLQHMAELGVENPPQAHLEPRAYEPLPTATDAQQQQWDMPPVGAASARGGTPPGGLSADQLVLPNLILPPPPQVHPPVPQDDMSVGGLLYNPVVPGSGPQPEDGLCPCCHSNLARAAIQPWPHECVCATCFDRGFAFACPACSSG